MLGNAAFYICEEDFGIKNDIPVTFVTRAQVGWARESYEDSLRAVMESDKAQLDTASQQSYEAFTKYCRLLDEYECLAIGTTERRAFARLASYLKPSD